MRERWENVGRRRAAERRHLVWSFHGRGGLRHGLPRYWADMLEHLDGQWQTTVGHLLSQQLDDLASEHLDDLSAAIPGFAEAFAWPHGEEAPEAGGRAAAG